MIIALLVLTLCATSFAHCPNEPMFTQTTNNDVQFFRLEASTMCGNRATESMAEVDICDIGSLNRLLTLAKFHIREAISELDNMVMFRRHLCEFDPMALPVSSGRSVASTLRNGISLLLDITMNITIISCHQNSRLETNLFPAMQAVICELKRLCTDLVPPEIFELRLGSLDRTDFFVFSCKNLRKAHSLLSDFKHDLNFDIQNVPVYGNGD